LNEFSLFFDVRFVGLSLPVPCFDETSEPAVPVEMACLANTLLSFLSDFSFKHFHETTGLLRADLRVGGADSRGAVGLIEVELVSVDILRGLAEIEIERRVL